MTLIVANWKMNGHLADIEPYIKALQGYSAVLCLPAPLLAAAVLAARGSKLAIGAQDCHTQEKGAFTGDTSAKVLAEIGCTYVIVGHSERRRDHGETDAQVWQKAGAAHKAGLKPILCIGDNQGEDVEGVLTRQLTGAGDFVGDSLVVAYEPVWAISANNAAGVMPTPAAIENRHKYIKTLVEKIKPTLSVPVLYGGSVKGENAAVILNIPHVDGALVGGASLPAAAFKAVLDAAG